jgi:hypothetical protein
MTYNGRSWSKPTTVSGPGAQPTAISCASPSFCVLVDSEPPTGQPGAFTFNGRSWSGPVRIDPTVDDAAVTSVSCPTASFCAAVDVDGDALTFSESAWSSPTFVDKQTVYGNPTQAGSPNSVSCPSASFCVAVDDHGNALTFNGSSWSAPTSIDVDNGDSTLSELTSVSCASASFCVAVDSGANALTFNGSSWSAPSPVERGRGELTSVSCISASFCAAAGGLPATFDGRRWATYNEPNGDAQGGVGVSCGSSSFCVAVPGGDGFNGQFSMYGTGSSAATGSRCVVPNLIGMKLPRARQALRNHGCTLGAVTRRKAARRKRNRIIGEYPLPGRAYGRGTPVAVTVGR